MRTLPLVSLLTLGLCHGLFAKVVYVDDNAASGGDGTSWASAHKYLQDALADVNASDEIWVAEGTYMPDQGAGKTVGDRTATFSLVNGVGMYGGFTGAETAREPLGDGNQTILSGEINEDSTLWSLHVVYGKDLDGNTTMDGFRITKGNANGIVVLASEAGIYLKNQFGVSEATLQEVLTSGAGMYLKNSDPTLANCIFTGNLASAGGGMLNTDSSDPTLANCVFTGNSAYIGGGMLNSDSSDPILTNCAFTGNSAGNRGGGMLNSDSSPVLSNCVFTNNSASYYGGGMYNNQSSLVLTNCMFSINTASEGGGMASRKGSSMLSNCAFTNNSTLYNGGGMYGIDSLSTLTNCTFTGNSTGFEGRGGGLNISGSTLTNCVFTGNSAERSGGGMVGDSSTLTNCIFLGNSVTGRTTSGGGLSISGSSTLTNCVFTGNSATRYGGGIYGSPTLINCVLWKNISNATLPQYRAEGHGIHGDSWKGIVLEEAVAPQFPGDPNAKDAVYFTSNILQGWTGDGRATSAYPLFVNIDDPDGPDDKWFTEDDGLRLKEGSPAIDAGWNASLPMDKADMDNDGDKTELIPYDLLGRTRLVGSAVDLGPYEFDPANPPPVFRYLIGVSVTTGGTATGGGDIEESKSTTLTATANTGYLFTGWSGGATGTSNPLTIMVEASRDITANFAQDTNDDDGDGLSNYAELVTHGTKADDSDTDNDGLLDNEEIQIGTNPKSSDATLVNYLNSKAVTRETTARTSALAEGRSEGQAVGIAAVKADPSAYGLAPIEELTASGATPHTNGWYYQPDWGWIWTNAKTFPYVYRSSSDGKTEGWLYFREGTADPILFYSYVEQKWVTLGEYSAKDSIVDKWAEWEANPEPYGGLEVLAKIHGAKESDTIQLDIVDEYITDLTPFGELTSLRASKLRNNHISDITPLAKLTRMEALQVNSNRISDISPLAGLTNLTNLVLHNNQIVDISPLASLTELNALSLEYNQIVDIAPLEQLTKLTWLNLSDNQITDISSLENLSKLENLWLEGNGISNISSLAKSPNMITLALSNNQINDISPLAALTKLDSLYLSGNDITDVTPLAGLTTLKLLYLGNNLISANQKNMLEKALPNCEIYFSD